MGSLGSASLNQTVYLNDNSIFRHNIGSDTTNSCRVFLKLGARTNQNFGSFLSEQISGFGSSVETCFAKKGDEVYVVSNTLKGRFLTYHSTTSSTECVVKIINGALPCYPQITNSNGDSFTIQSFYLADGNGKSIVPKGYYYDSANSEWVQFCGERNEHKINATIQNGTADASNPTIILDNSTTTFTYYFDGTNYIAPTNGPKIDNCSSYTYTRVSDQQANITISYPYDNIEFTLVGKAPATDFNTTITCTGFPDPDCTITYNGSTVYNHIEGETMPQTLIIPFTQGATMQIESYVKYGYVNVTLDGVTIQPTSTGRTYTYSWIPSEPGELIIYCYGED